MGCSNPHPHCQASMWQAVMAFLAECTDCGQGIGQKKYIDNLEA